MSHLRQAFEHLCEAAKPAQHWYVSLIEDVQFYGGPEEGGWWGTDSVLIAYQHCETEERANALQEEIEKFAQELTAEARKAHGEHCLRQLNWLEERGLDADFLPEDDGPSKYRVTVTEHIPKSRYGRRHYE